MTSKYKLNYWQDYWKYYNLLIKTLEKRNQNELVLQLRDAQKYVNGLTDGWFEFKFAFEKVLLEKKEVFSEEESEIIEFLLKELNKSLANR